MEMMTLTTTCPKCGNQLCVFTEPPFTHNGVPVKDMLAYPARLAAKLMGVSYTTVWRKVRLGEMKGSPLGLISRAEIERFLADDKKRK